MTKHLVDHMYLIFDEIAVSIIMLHPSLADLVRIRNMYAKQDDCDYIVDLFDLVVIKGMTFNRWTHEDIEEEMKKYDDIS